MTHICADSMMNQRVAASGENGSPKMIFTSHVSVFVVHVQCRYTCMLELHVLM